MTGIGRFSFSFQFFSACRSAQENVLIVLDLLLFLEMAHVLSEQESKLDSIQPEALDSQVLPGEPFPISVVESQKGVVD